MQSPPSLEPSSATAADIAASRRREQKDRTEHDDAAGEPRVAQAWGDTDTTSVTSIETQDHEHHPLPQRPPADSTSTEGSAPQEQEPPQRQLPVHQSIVRIASTAAASSSPAAPAGPTKRDSLRAFAPLLRRVSQEVKNSPWAIALNSTRAKEKRTLEQGITRFNQKPAAGIEYLVSNGVLQRTPAEVAGFLRQHAGELSKKRIGEYVGSHDPFAHEVLHQLLQEYDFQGMAIDEAMRVRMGGG